MDNSYESSPERVRNNFRTPQYIQRLDHNLFMLMQRSIEPSFEVVISMIVPAYNESRIRRAMLDIQEALGNNTPIYEIIIAKGESTERMKIVSSMVNVDTNIQVLGSYERRERENALERAIKASEGCNRSSACGSNLSSMQNLRAKSTRLCDP